MGSRPTTLRFDRFDSTALWMAGRREPPNDTEVSGALVERALVQRTLGGDADAFGQIVVRHERRILGLSLRFMGNVADAQDASQETFLRAFRYLHRFNRDKPLGPWLMRIAVNVCSDMSRRRPKTQDLEVVPAPSDGGTPHSDLAAEEDRRQLRQALGRLPDKQRAAIVLRDIEGLPTREVAEILGSSESTVRVQISNGRLRLREILQQRHPKSCQEKK